MSQPLFSGSSCCHGKLGPVFHSLISSFLRRWGEPLTGLTYLSPDLSWSCQPPIPVARGSRAGRGRGSRGGRGRGSKGGRGRGGRAGRGRGSKGGKNRDRRGGRGKRLLRVDRRGQGNLAFQVFGWLGSLPVYKVLEVSGQNNPSALFSSRELRKKECFPGRRRQS